MKKITSLFLVCLLVFSGCTLFKKDPQKAVDEGILKFSEVEKLSSSLIFNGVITAPVGEKPSKIDFSFQVDGKTDTSDKEKPKVDSKMKLEMTVDGQKGSGELMVTAVDESVYLKLANISLPGETGQMVNTQFASLLDTWWTLPAADSNPLGKIGTQQEEIKALFTSTKFFTNAVEIGKEDVNGLTLNKYSVDLDKTVLRKFVLDVARISKNQLTPEEEAAIGESLEEVAFSGAIWVGKDDYLHKIKGTVTVQPKQGSSSSFDIDYFAWDYGKSVDISAPEKVQEFNPNILSILGALNNAVTGGVQEGENVLENQEN